MIRDNPQARHERSEPLDESQRVKRDRRRAIAPAATQAVDHATVGGKRESFAGDGRASDIAAQMFEPLPLPRGHADLGVQ